MTRFYVGTAGWSYLQWEKEFYPKGTKSGEKLAFYATRLSAVELNNTFYHTPPPEQFATWQNQVPSSFRFAVKAPRFITHTKKLADAEKTVPPFMKALALLEKTGPIFFQLPPSFPFNLQRLADFLEQLQEGHRYAVELRGSAWEDPSVYQLLKKHKIAMCLYDTPEGVSARLLTADFAYIRLRGRKVAGLHKFLQEWHGWLSDNAKEAYVFFDNREEKRLAFGNALAFQAIVNGEQGSCGDC